MVFKLMNTMNKRQFLTMLVFTVLIVGCDTNTPSFEEDKTDYMVEMEKFAKRVLKDPATFEMDFKTEQDSLEISITESPDGNVRFYTWWNGAGGTMVCNDNIYQTRFNNKVRAFDWRNEEEENYYPNFPLAIRQVESTEGTVYLLLSVFTEWSTCHAFEVSAFKMNKHGELKPTYIFDKVESLPDVELVEEKSYRIYIEIYGTPPLSLFIDNGWVDNFFFDLSGEDVYMPVFDADPNSKYVNLYFHDYYHHFHWNGERFEYRYLKYNPILEQYVGPSDLLVCEFDLGKSFIRIEKMRDGTYRYIAWTREKMFTDEPDLVIENGWYHEVERVFHFTNNNHEYVFDASEYRLHIYRTDPKTGKTEEIANYHIDDIYSQITGAF